MATDIDNILNLPVAERLQIVERILNSLSDNNVKTEIPEWHKDILQERLRNYEGKLTEGKSWEEVKRSFQRLGVFSL